MSVVPTGELDIASVGELRERIDELITAGFADLVIDLPKLRFIDSAGASQWLSTSSASAWRASPSRSAARLSQ